MITLLVSLIVLSLVYWLVSLLPLPAPFNLIVKVVFILVAIVMILRFVGIVIF